METSPPLSFATGGNIAAAIAAANAQIIVQLAGGSYLDNLVVDTNTRYVLSWNTPAAPNLYGIQSLLIHATAGNFTLTMIAANAAIVAQTALGYCLKKMHVISATNYILHFERRA